MSVVGQAWSSDCDSPIYALFQNRQKPLIDDTHLFEARGLHQAIRMSIEVGREGAIRRQLA